jgi:hypothetical protein
MIDYNSPKDADIPHLKFFPISLEFAATIAPDWLRPNATECLLLVDTRLTTVYPDKFYAVSSGQGVEFAQEPQGLILGQVVQIRQGIAV